MIKLITSTTSIGLEASPKGIKTATVLLTGKTPSLKKLSAIQPASDDVKPLYTGHPITTSALEGKDVLVRYLHMPVTKEKDIEEALGFQAEPILPFPVEEAILSYQILAKGPEGSELTLLAVRKEVLQAHLDLWKPLKIEPEKVACVQTALACFGNHFISSVKTYLIFHIQRSGMTCVLMKEGKLYASFALADGLEPILTSTGTESEANFLQSGIELNDAFKKIQKDIAKMGLALAKELKSQEIEGIFVTGEAAEYEGISSNLVKELNLPLLTCDPNDNFTSSELLSYAVPIGLALGSLPGSSSIIDFRQEEFDYPHPWKRLVGPIALYFASIFLLSFAFYFFGQQYLHYQEDQLKQSYVDLLGGMHKSHEQFESSFVVKNPGAHDAFDGEIPRVEQIRQDDLKERLSFLQKELQAAPDSFPLFANTPRASDVFAWLSRHPAVASLDEQGNPETRLQIDNFSYTMVKRPQQGKKQEKYQVKIDLEFTSPTPKWAREFHDALIAPNDWVDPKGEIKWNTNRGKYKTTFFLKDKTVYPSGAL